MFMYLTVAAEGPVLLEMLLDVSPALHLLLQNESLLILCPIWYPRAEGLEILQSLNGGYASDLGNGGERNGEVGGMQW